MASIEKKERLTNETYYFILNIFSIKDDYYN